MGVNAAELAKILSRPERTLTQEDYDSLRPHIAGTKDPDRNPDGSFQSWDPKERAVTRNVQPPHCAPTRDWLAAKDAAAAFGKDPLVIVGAGSSLLQHDLGLLDHLPSMGINWTLQWFQPTYLHVLDKQPFRTQIVENHDQSGIESQIVTCRSTREWAEPLGLKLPVLEYEVKDDSCGKYPSFQLARREDDLFQSFPNSLGYALQVAVVLGFHKVILAGFDFGGFHFFGDGRKVGCANHYGDSGVMKQYLHPMLMAQAHALHLHGVRVVQVGPTDLKDCYRVVPDFVSALTALGSEENHG